MLSNNSLPLHVERTSFFAQTTNNEGLKTNIIMEIRPQLSFTEAFNSATSKIFQFTGRARRSEYWWIIGLVVLIDIVLTSLFSIFSWPIAFLLYLATIPLTFRRLHDSGRSGWWWGAGVILQIAFVLAMVYDVVIASVQAASLNDYDYTFNHSDLSFFITFVTKYSIWALIIGVYKIVMFVFMCLDSNQYTNKYGESPKYMNDDEVEGSTYFDN